MSRPLRLVFFGTPEFALPAFELLLAGRHEVVAAVTRPPKARGRGQARQASPVAARAQAAGIETLAPATPADDRFQDRLGRLSPDLGVVVAYGRILPASLLGLAPLGFINAHASLLPLLRGAAPIERAILAGFATTGVTIMRLDEGLDTGDIMTIGEHPIAAHTDSGKLSGELSHIAAGLLAEAVELLADGNASFASQDHGRATHAPPVTKDEARIDWSDGAEAIERRVLAFSPTPGAFSFDEERRIIVLEAHRAVGESSPADPGRVAAASGDRLGVSCGEGVLVVSRVKPAGGRAMSAGEYLRGRRGSGELHFSDPT